MAPSGLALIMTRSSSKGSDPALFHPYFAFRIVNALWQLSRCRSMNILFIPVGAPEQLWQGICERVLGKGASR